MITNNKKRRIRRAFKISCIICRYPKLSYEIYIFLIKNRPISYPKWKLLYCFNSKNYIKYSKLKII